MLGDIERATGSSGAGTCWRALTRLKQVCNHPVHAARRRLAAGRSLRQARPAGRDARRAARRGRQRRWCSPSSPRWAAARATTCRRTLGLEVLFCTAASRRLAARHDGRPVPAGRRPAGASCCRCKAGGTGLNLTAGQPRLPLRPLVEPGGRGPGHRPRVSHRPDADRPGAQAHLRGHGRGAHRPADRRQAGLAEQSSSGGESWLSELSDQELSELVALRTEA